VIDVVEALPLSDKSDSSLPHRNSRFSGKARHRRDNKSSRVADVNVVYFN